MKGMLILLPIRHASRISSASDHEKPTLVKAVLSRPRKSSETIIPRRITIRIKNIMPKGL
jgi:phage gp29-like protein